jgi:hypothetical protein
MSPQLMVLRGHAAKPSARAVPRRRVGARKITARSQSARSLSIFSGIRTHTLEPLYLVVRGDLAVSLGSVRGLVSRSGAPARRGTPPPGAGTWHVLVGGTAAALHAGHRVSFDGDHVLADLAGRFDEVLADLESVAGWRTNRIRRPVLILGSLEGVLTGIRQLRRVRPLPSRRRRLSDSRFLR